MVVTQQPPTPSTPSNTPEEIIGMGRLILQIVDIAVQPSHQGKGIGCRILEKLLSYADANAPDAYISLVGDHPAYETFYPRFGFRDVEPVGACFACGGSGLRIRTKN
jgi:predicted N-acetyltransferase YhbS